MSVCKFPFYNNKIIPIFPDSVKNVCFCILTKLLGWNFLDSIYSHEYNKYIQTLIQVVYL